MELIAEVFDGGWGDHPLMLRASAAWTRACHVYGEQFMNRLIGQWIAVNDEG